MDKGDKPIVLNKTLYNKVKASAKKKFKKWPSAYASAWVVKEYKRKGGKYKGTKPLKTGINRWMDEKWINVCKLPKIVSCGRKKLSAKNWKSKYPYCRPLKRITSKTPKTASELTKQEIKRRCSIKTKEPMKRITSKSVKNFRKSRKKSSRKSRKSPRRSRKSNKRSRKSRKTHKSRKRSPRRSRKSPRRSRKSPRRSRKSHRRSRKSS